MIRIRPFRALHYDSRRGRSERGHRTALRRHRRRRARRGCTRAARYNVVRLILNREAIATPRRPRDLAAWRRDGVLTRDAAPCLLLLRAGLRPARRRHAPARRSARGRGAPGALCRRQHPAARAHLPERQGRPPAADGGVSAPISARSSASTRAAPTRWRRRAPRRSRRRGWTGATKAAGATASGGSARRPLIEATAPHPRSRDGVHRRRASSLRNGARTTAIGAGARRDRRPRRRTISCSCTSASMDEPGPGHPADAPVWRGAVDARRLARRRGEGASMIEEFRRRLATASAEPERAAGARQRAGVLGLRLGDAVPRTCCACAIAPASRRWLTDVAAVVRELDVTVLDALPAGGLARRSTAERGAGRGSSSTPTTTVGQRAGARRRRRRRLPAAQSAHRRGRDRLHVRADACRRSRPTFYPKLQSGLVFHLLDADD